MTSGVNLRVNSSKQLHSRRNLILALSGLGFAAFAAQQCGLIGSLPSFSSSSGSILLGGRYRLDNIVPTAYQSYEQYKDNFLFKFDLVNNRLEQVRSLTPAHCTQPNPLNSLVVACATRRSNRVSLFDWTSQQEISAFVTGPSQYVYGHSAFTADGKKLLVPAVDIGTNPLKSKTKPQGILYILDVPSLKLSDQISLGSYKAHDIVAIGSDRYVCGLLGENPGIASFGIVDYAAKSFQSYSKKVEGLSKILAINHLKKENDVIYGIGNIFEDTRLKAGGMLKFEIENQRISLSFPIGLNRAFSEVLSIEFDNETGYAWITVPDQNIVIVWNVKKDQLVSILDVFSVPSSVILAASIDAIVIGTSRGIKAFDRKSLKNLNRLDEKWGQLDLNKFAAAHTRII